MLGEWYESRLVWGLVSGMVSGFPSKVGLGVALGVGDLFGLGS